MGSVLDYLKGFGMLVLILKHSLGEWLIPLETDFFV